MKGFLIKDYRLLMAQRNLLIVLPIGLIFMFTNETPVMGISYTLYVLTFLSTSILSYDTFDNGMAYLMTQPGGRKAYVTGKYFFIFLNASLAALLLAAIGSILELSRGHGFNAVAELCTGTLLLYSFALAFAYIILPLQLKFGPEKSRVVMLIVFGVFFLGASALSFLSEKLEFLPDALMERLNQLPLIAPALAAFILVALLTGFSWGISQRIMRNMEF